MDRKNMILGIIALVLFIFVLFSAFRGGITGAAALCDDCVQAEDCEDYCYGFCVKKAYDVVTADGVEADGDVKCTCTCESYLNNLITGR